MSDGKEMPAWRVEAKTREAFEFVAAEVFSMDIRRLGGVYLNTRTQDAWEQWIGAVHQGLLDPAGVVRK